MEAWVSVPIESCQIQRLIDQLGRRGGAPDLQQALADHYSLQRNRQADLKPLRDGLQLLRKQRVRRAREIDPLPPLRPWPSASANTAEHDTHT